MRKRLPVVLSKQEIQAIFSVTRNLKHKALPMIGHTNTINVLEIKMKRRISYAKSKFN